MLLKAELNLLQRYSNNRFKASVLPNSRIKYLLLGPLEEATFLPRYHPALLQRWKETGTKYGIVPTLLTTYGLKPGINSGAVKRTITMNDLFK